MSEFNDLLVCMERASMKTKVKCLFSLFTSRLIQYILYTIFGILYILFLTPKCCRLSHLGGFRFQNFPGGACPGSPWSCLPRSIIPPFPPLSLLLHHLVHRHRYQNRGQPLIAPLIGEATTGESSYLMFGRS